MVGFIFTMMQKIMNRAIVILIFIFCPFKIKSNMNDENIRFKITYKEKTKARSQK